MALTVGTNAYGDVAGSITYFNDSLRKDTWSALATSVKSAALIEATRYLERFTWKGEKTVSSQALSFPRTGLVDKDGAEIADDSVPTIIVEASYEIAIRIGQDPSLLDSFSSQSVDNVKKVKAGSVDVEFFPSTDSKVAGSPAANMFDWVYAAIGHLIDGNGDSISAGIGGAASFGTSEESFFSTGGEKYGLNDGYY